MTLTRIRGFIVGQDVTQLLAFVLPLVYVVLVCSKGVPALRHDWLWPRERYTFIDDVLSTSGWNTSGLGAPSPHPGGYIVGTCVAVIGLLFGPLVTLVIFTSFIAGSISLGARALAKILRVSPAQTIALEVFALFNPWVYNKTVAGHLYMLLAYGACFAIVAELLRVVPRQRRLALLLTLVLPQLQFFLIVMAAVTIHGLLRRVYWPLLSGVVIASPVWAGLVFDRSSLLHIPYTLAWEASQSVAPTSAVVLTGYFANYAAHFSIFQIGAVWVLVVCACLGAISARDRMLPKLAVLAIAGFLIAAMGTRGVLGSSYASIVMHFPESGVFRELYDLLAFVAIGYCVLIGHLSASARFRVAGHAALLASLVMATAWTTFPPSSYWIGSDQLPYVDVVAAANTRFALYPAYQPMQFEGKGSGADPDAHGRPGNVTPINQYLAEYPINVALSSFALHGNAKPLADLSTSLIVQRPWLKSDDTSLRLQINGAAPSLPTRKLSNRHLTPLPEVSLESRPLVGSLVNVLGAGNILFADAREVTSPPAPADWRSFPTLLPIRVPNEFIDESKGWIDAQFDFEAYPDLGQGLGGAVTTNTVAKLPVRAGYATLVNVNGVLRSQDDRVVTQTTRGYQWVQLGNGVVALRCSGRCVVVGQAKFQRVPPLNPPPRRYKPATFRTLAPWLVSVQIPAKAPPSLRYNVSYDPNWTAIAMGSAPAHVRLDATVNGWLLAPSEKPYIVYLVHRVALAQTLLEVLGGLWVVALVLSGHVSGQLTRTNRTLV